MGKHLPDYIVRYHSLFRYQVDTAQEGVKSAEKRACDMHREVCSLRQQLLSAQQKLQTKETAHRAKHGGYYAKQRASGRALATERAWEVAMAGHLPAPWSPGGPSAGAVVPERWKGVTGPGPNPSMQGKRAFVPASGIMPTYLM